MWALRDLSLWVYTLMFQSLRLSRNMIIQEQFLSIGHANNFVPRFTAKHMWNAIRQAAPIIPWYNAVLFNGAVPKYSFQMRIATLDRLPTRDHLCRWIPNTMAQCLMRNFASESRYRIENVLLYY